MNWIGKIYEILYVKRAKKEIFVFAIIDRFSPWLEFNGSASVERG